MNSMLLVNFSAHRNMDLDKVLDDIDTFFRVTSKCLYVQLSTAEALLCPNLGLHLFHIRLYHPVNDQPPAICFIVMHIEPIAIARHIFYIFNLLKLFSYRMNHSIHILMSRWNNSLTMLLTMMRTSSTDI